MSTDFEKRLRELEKRARIDDVRWAMLDGSMKGAHLVLQSLGAPLAAISPAVLRTIIQNLRNYEEAAKTMNEHTETISQLRSAREFFEGRLPKTGEDGSTASDGGEHRR